MHATKGLVGLGLVGDLLKTSPVVVAHTFSPSIQEAEASGSLVAGG